MRVLLEHAHVQFSGPRFEYAAEFQPIHNPWIRVVQKWRMPWLDGQLLEVHYSRSESIAEIFLNDRCVGFGQRTTPPFWPTRRLPIEWRSGDSILYQSRRRNGCGAWNSLETECGQIVAVWILNTCRLDGVIRTSVPASIAAFVFGIMFYESRTPTD